MDVEKLAMRFHEKHRDTYGIFVETEPILLVSARLQATEARRRSFLADVTHELRTPLSVIRGQTEGILSRAETEKLIGLCWDIGRLKDAGESARASVPVRKTAKRAAS